MMEGYNSDMTAALPLGNLCRYDGQNNHYEVWYVTGHSPEHGLGWWIRTTLEHPTHGEPYAAQWFSVFDANQNRRAGWCRRFPMDAFSALQNPFEVSLKGEKETIRLTQGSYEGQLTRGEKQARWRLDWTPDERVHLHFPEWLYGTPFISTKVLCPTVNGHASGFLEWEGKRVDVSGAPICQTHLWGVKHAEAWGWGHCNAFENAPGVVLETVSAQVKKGALTLPVLTTLRFTCPEVDFDFRNLLVAATPRCTFRPGLYQLELSQGPWRLQIKFTSPYDRLLVADYEDPDGEKSFCHFSGLADCWVSVEKRSGLIGHEPVATYVARRTASFEAASRMPTANLPHIEQYGFGLGDE